MLSRIAARGAVGFIVVPFGVVGEICFQAAFGLIEGSLKSLQNLSRSGIYARHFLIAGCFFVGHECPIHSLFNFSF